MANTTNFNWETPDDTDLVKDGAAAMRTLGNSIDTSFVDLKGGTTGQILSKASNTDLDYTWVTTDDANAIQNAIVDAKGDLIAATAADTPARLAVGTNGTSLVADSTAATGLKWGYQTSLGCLLYKTANQSISNAVETTVSFDGEVYDTSNFHDNTTNNSRMTIPAGLGGKYLVNVNFAYAANATGQRVGYIFTGLGGLYMLNAISPNSTASQANVSFSAILNMTAGDYIEMKTYQDSGGSLNLLGAALWYTNFQIAYLGA
jgi:hypothetical protein